MTEYERKHRELLQALANEIDGAYTDFSKDISRQRVDIGEDMLKWTAVVGLSAYVDKLGRELIARIERAMVRSVAGSYRISDHEARARVWRYEHRTIAPTRDIEQRARRFVRNLDLSDRVWNPKYKNEVRMAIDTAFRDGRIPDEVARDIKKYLREPDRLYRRVRDRHGNLVLSKNAKLYKPGQGVYRSSYKNTIRLATNELHKAYRMEEWKRWQQTDYIIGYRISVSARLGSGVCPLCEHLQGDYPKSFRWYSWHPNCLCFASPIYAGSTEDIMRGNYSTRQPPMPDNFKQWILDNAKKIRQSKERGTTPYFIGDNKQIVVGIIRDKGVREIS